MDNNVTPLCKDCKYNRADWISRSFNLNPKDWECEQAMSVGKIDYLTGKRTPNYYQSCSMVRSSMSFQCGPDGKLWSPRNTKKFLFKLIKKDFNAS